MSRSLSVHLLPTLMRAEDLTDGVAVVIDVLRATTTIIHALAAGAARVIPCGETDEARQRATAFPAGAALLGGERGGVKISGFDLGNTPTEYSPQTVQRKTVVFTTTNGTRAMLAARSARRVLIGAFVNRQALVEALARETGAVHLVCAGTDGHVTLEDVLFAGLVSVDLCRGGDFVPDDSTRLAMASAEADARSPERLLQAMNVSRGGANLLSLGYGRDVETAARLDAFALVPELHREPWQIV